MNTKFRNRELRDSQRSDLAAVVTRAAGGNAIDVACARAKTLRGPATGINMLKLNIEHVLELVRTVGLSHPKLIARYGARARELQGCTLAAAILKLDHWYAKERRTDSVGAAFGFGGSPLSKQVLTELRIITRLIALKPEWAQWRDHFAGITACLAGLDREYYMEAAE